MSALRAIWGEAPLTRPKIQPQLQPTVTELVASTQQRIAEIRKTDMPLRTALGMLEFELSGRDFALFKRQTTDEVRLTRNIALVLLFNP